LIELRLASRCNIKRRTMSLLGHKQTYAVQKGMLATAKADIRDRPCLLYP
jgi:hypothetical protein